MRTTTDIVFGVIGQNVEHRVNAGRPTSATFEVFDDTAGDDTTPDFSGSAVVDTVTTTVSASSGPSQSDAQKLYLTSTAGIVTTRKYLLAESSRQEIVQPVEVTATYVVLRHPLKSDYTTSATFVGNTITAAIDATWVATEGNIGDQIDQNPSYRVRWEILVGGATTVEYSYFDLVRAAITHQVDIDDINARAPGLVDSIPTEYRIEQGRPLVHAAWLSVQAKLAALKTDTDAIRDNQVLDELVILRALNILARGGWRPAGFDTIAEYIATTQDDYDRFIEQHFQVSQPHKLAAGSSGAAETVSAVAYWSK